MKRFAHWFCIALVLCMLSGFMSLGYSEEAETEAEQIPAPTEEAIPAEESVPAEQEKTPAQWTVMIYLCGSDLESDNGMATENLQMISRTVPNDQVNVVFQTGGAKAWKAEEKLGIDIATDRLQRWSYSADGFTLVDEQENASMAKHTTLSDFIRWGAENYPAEKNILILWDHGGGSSTGLILDELHRDAIMSLEGLERALKNGGVHFDICMTDTCLMATLETAQAVKDYADYLLASEETLPGLGNNYEEFLQDLYDEPDCRAVRLGKIICNSAELMYAEQGDNSELKGLTFSMIDLSRIDTVAEAFDAFMKEVIDLVPDPLAFGPYLAAVSKTDRYMDRNMWDLYDLARRSVFGGISKATAQKLENAVDDAVVICVRGAYHPYSHGLSAFLTYNGSTGVLDRLARSGKNPWQLAFLDAVSLKWDAPEWVVDVVGEIPQLEPELYTVRYDTEIAEDQSNQRFHVYFAGFNIGGYIRYELQRYDEDLQVWYDLGESENLKTISVDENGITFAADFTGKWPAIAGEFLSVSSKDLQGKTVLMQASVRIPSFTKRVKKLRILAEYPEDMILDSKPDEDGEEALEEAREETAAAEKGESNVTYQVAGLWDGFDSSTGLSDRNTLSVADLLGAEMEICRPVYSDYFESIGDIRYGEPFSIGLDLEVVDTVLPAGQYRLRYSIQDMLDRTYKTDFVELTWDGKNAVFNAPTEQ